MMAIRKRQIISIKEEVEMLEIGTLMLCEQERKNGATALENIWKKKMLNKDLPCDSKAYAQET